MGEKVFKIVMAVSGMTSLLPVAVAAFCQDAAMAILLVPGFMADETLWNDVAPALERFGPVVHADLRHDTSVDAMARHVLETTPPTFLLVGFSMGANNRQSQVIDFKYLISIF